MAAKIAAADVDPLAIQVPPVTPHWRRRRTIVFVLVGLVAYLVALIAWIPASFLVTPNDNVRLGGTMWNGQAVVGSGLRIEWHFAPITSLANVALAADWRATGGGTDLIGTAAWHGRQTVLTNISGQADGTLLGALAPGLPFACRFTADVDARRIAIGGSGQTVDARMTTGPVSCAARDIAAPPVELPALAGSMVPASAMLSSGALLTTDTSEHLVEFRLTRSGMLSVWPTAMAVSRAAFLAGQRYDTTLD